VKLTEVTSLVKSHGVEFITVKINSREYEAIHIKSDTEGLG
jgi:hypothetical protein